MNKNCYSLNYVLGCLLLLAVFFPWVSFRINSMDTQPWAFICSVLFLASCYRYRVLKNIVWPFLLVFSAVISSFFFLGEDVLAIFRGLSSYLFLVTVFLSCWYYFSRYGFPRKAIYFFNFIYLFVGVVQYKVGGSVFEFISPVRTTESRGVTSLAVEPTNFGLVLLLFCWIYLIIGVYRVNKLEKILISLNVIAIFFLAKSSMVIFFFFVFLFFSIIYNLKLTHFILLVLLFLFIDEAFFYFFSESRVSLLLSKLTNVGFLALVENDASLNYRVSSVIFPYQGVVSNFFLPGGFTSFKNVSIVLKESWSGLFWYGEHNKIMSFVGSFVYELGFFGFIFIMSFWITIQNGSYRRFLESIYLFILLNMAIPVASPLIAFLLCLLIYTRKKEHHNKCTNQ